ncbi:helix-turn-helix domain-containing protein [Amycolatopsis sp. NPDC051372]|uniref:helix-turn-helix domain-containing protein n=1 Tax=Amycolatopsis sp. NPDC051372 TaxID=3155669 RepID=UPI0034341C06
MLIVTPMSPTEAARTVGCHQNSIYAALLSGELKGYQRTAPKGRWRIFPDDLAKWLKGE